MKLSKMHRREKYTSNVGIDFTKANGARVFGFELLRPRAKGGFEAVATVTIEDFQPRNLLMEDSLKPKAAAFMRLARIVMRKTANA